MQEVTASLAAAQDISTDAGVAAILSKMGIKRKKTALKVLLGRQRPFDSPFQ